MIGWRSHLGATRVLVASDRLAANPVASGVLGLTSPKDAGLVIDTVEGMVRRIREGEFDADRAMLLFEGLPDILRAMDFGLPLAELNLGGIRHRDSCVCFSPAVSLSAEDVRAARLLLERGVRLGVQMVPLEKCEALDRRRLESMGAGA
jgi:PTS system mannose-specific IIB component